MQEFQTVNFKHPLATIQIRREIEIKKEYEAIDCEQCFDSRYE